LLPALVVAVVLLLLVVAFSVVRLLLAATCGKSEWPAARDGTVGAGTARKGVGVVIAELDTGAVAEPDEETEVFPGTCSLLGLEVPRT
jgi:hypothetical protein